MTRRMSDSAFVAEQTALLHEPHIAPITGFIDSLRTPDLWLPYVAPHHAGVHARMLTVLRDPGRATRLEGGSGMLSVENDDPTAEKQFELMTSVGLTLADFTPWNAYPWFIDRAPTDAELRDASSTLVGLLDLLPDLEVVLLQGHEAQSAWRIALEAQPAIRRRRLIMLETYHPSPQALWHKSPDERARRTQHRLDAWREAAEILNG
jgi:hypothetical protein